MVDTTRLRGQMVQQFVNCTVLDIPSGDAPKLITVRLTTIDGPANVARWFGFPAIGVGDNVICRRDPNDLDVLIVEGSGDEAISSGAWPAPGEIMIGIERYSTFAAAAAALSPGDVIKLGPGTYTCDAVTVSTLCRIVCSIKGAASLLTTTSANALIIDGATVVMENVSAFSSLSTSNNAIKVTNGGDLTVIGVTAQGNCTSTGAGSGVRLENSGSGGVLTAIDSEIYGLQSGAALGYGVTVENNGSSAATLIDTLLDGDTDDLNVLGGTVTMHNARLVNGTISNAGTLVGWYYDAVLDRNIYAPTSDIASLGTKDGLGRKIFEPITTVSITDHFQSGSIPSGYSWQGAPFAGTPTGILSYAYNNDFLRARETSSRIFLAESSGLPAIGDSYGCRLAPSNAMNCGVRIDDGTDNNYYEALLEDLGDGTIRVVMRERSGGGSVTTTTGTAFAFATLGYIISILIQDRGGGSHRPVVRIWGEIDRVNVHTGSDVSWTIGRAGLINNGTLSANSIIHADWIGQ